MFYAHTWEGLLVHIHERVGVWCVYFVDFE